MISGNGANSGKKVVVYEEEALYDIAIQYPTPENNREAG